MSVLELSPWGRRREEQPEQQSFEPHSHISMAAAGPILFPGEQESSATDLVVLESYVKPSVFVRLHPFTPMTSVP